MSPSRSRKAHRIGMLLLPGFNSMAAQAFIDPFCAANYLRDGGEAQVPRRLQPVGYQVPDKLREAIVLMERNVEEPLSQPELAEYLALSVRQLQRIFRRHIGLTPVRYYLNLRLDRARGLVTQTELPMMDIAALCGFGRAEQFSRAYVRRFDLTPTKDRIEGRIPFQFRHFTGRAGYHSVV